MALAGIIVATSACTADVAESTSTVATSTSIVTLLPEGDPVDASLPEDYLDGVLSDLEGLTGLDRAQFSVLDDSAVEWASQRLGCVHLPEPSDPMPVDAGIRWASPKCRTKATMTNAKKGRTRSLRSG
jgi:hypothetical protein